MRTFVFSVIFLMFVLSLSFKPVVAGNGTIPTVPSYTAKTVGGSDGYYIINQSIYRIHDNTAELIWIANETGHSEVLPDGNLTYFVRPNPRWVILDNTYQEIEVPAWPDELDHHDVILTPSGSWIVMFYRHEQMDLTSFGGGPSVDVTHTDVAEIDASGVELWRWTSETENYIAESRIPLTPESTSYDYAHGNALDVMPNGNIAANMRNTNTVVIVERGTGKTLKKITDDSTYSDYEIDDPFLASHNIDFHSDTVFTVYDNHAFDPVIPSRGARYEIVDDEIFLRQTWVHPDGSNNFATGNHQMLENGGVVIGWGTLRTGNENKRIGTEYDSDGNEVMSVWTNQDIIHYRVTKIEDGWDATPWYSPELTKVDDSLWVNWNGATDIESWNIIINGEQVSNVEKDEFYTEVEVSNGCTFQAVPIRDGKESTPSNVIDVCPNKIRFPIIWN